MARSYAQHSIRGEVRKVEMIVLTDKASKITFSVPHTVNWYDKEAKEWKKQPTTWYNCFIFGNPANAWFARAQRDIVEGKYIIIDSMDYDVKSYEKKDGSKGMSYGWKVNAFHVVGGGDEQEVTGKDKGIGATRAPEPEKEGEDGLPF
jgi:single-stranded DNA-binding protein